MEPKEVLFEVVDPARVLVEATKAEIAIDIAARAGICLACAAGNGHARDRANRGNRFAAKAKCANVEEVFGLMQFAGGVTFHRQGQLGGGNATAIL